MSNVDDGSIANDARLLRRVHPDQIVDDRNYGERRLSTAPLKDPQMSVDAEPLLPSGKDWRFSLRNHSGYSLVSFPAATARGQNLAVISNPEADNPAHTEVVCKKTQAIANALRDGSNWIHLEPKPQ